MIFSLQAPCAGIKLCSPMKRSILCLIILLFGCSSPTPRQPMTLRLAFNTMPTTFDPRASGDFASSTLICLLYEGLTRCLPGDAVEPAIAHQIDLSPDGRTYTFHLRKTFWSDGQPVTARDFEQSWKQIADPNFPSPSAYLLFPIKNAEQCKAGKLPLSSMGVYAIDDDTLVVELNHPTPYFLSLTAFPLFLPIPSHIENPNPESLISNGPFLIKTLKPNSEIYLEKNGNFWNREAILIDAIRISILNDETTALRLFEEGELDWLGAPLAQIPLDAIPSLQKTNEIHSVPMAASTFIAFNTTTTPFNNKHLREALSFSLNRSRLAKETALIGQIPAVQYLPPSLTQHNLPQVQEDPERAAACFKQALEELSLNPSDLESLTLYYRAGQIEKRLAQTLQREWKEFFGFTIKIEQLDAKTHMHKLHNKEYQIAMGCWIAQFHDPSNILERYRIASNPKNFAGWEHPSYASLLEEAATTLDRDKRKDLLREAEKIFGEEIPISPLYHWAGLSISNPELQHIATTPSGGILFERFSLNRDRPASVVE